MTPEQWAKIKLIAGDAWALPELEREVYVRSVCVENEALRIEVMNLLAAMRDAAGAFDRLLDGSRPVAGEDRRPIGPTSPERRRDLPVDK